MDMKIVIRENRPVEFTYWVSGVNSIEEGRKAAAQCYRTHEETDACYLGRTIPLKIHAEFGAVEITKVS